MYKAHTLLQAAACFRTPLSVPSPLYFNTNLQISICTHLSATETGTKRGRNLKAENHNWTVSEKVERQISFPCYLGCITTCFFKYKIQTVMPSFFSKTTYMKLYIYDTHSITVFPFSALVHCVIYLGRVLCEITPNSSLIHTAKCLASFIYPPRAIKEKQFP